MENIDDFVMPEKIIKRVEKLSNHYPKKNEDKILSLMNEHGIDICNNTHEEDYDVFEWKHLGYDDEYEHHESCLGCGGLRE